MLSRNQQKLQLTTVRSLSSLFLRELEECFGPGTPFFYAKANHRANHARRRNDLGGQLRRYAALPPTRVAGTLAISLLLGRVSVRYSLVKRSNMTYGLG